MASLKKTIKSLKECLAKRPAGGNSGPGMISCEKE
jgi:hypothetical protein